MKKKKIISALAPFYGSNRMLAPHVGELLSGCVFVAVPFAGGMSELFHLKARTMIVNDLHRHVINLAQCVACPDGYARLIERLAALPFHPDVLAAAQARCVQREAADLPFVPENGDVEWAVDYFASAWMSRNGKAGTADEFSAGLSFRWEAGGGDSAVRLRNATAALADWHKIMRRCTFTTLDVFTFLDKCKDNGHHGLYVDAPWPEDGDSYKHRFGTAQQRRLAPALTAFQQTRIVVRFGDHPLIRELYQPPHWHWQEMEGRTAANKAKAEVLLVRN